MPRCRDIVLTESAVPRTVHTVRERSGKKQTTVRISNKTSAIYQIFFLTKSVVFLYKNPIDLICREITRHSHLITDYRQS